MCVGAQIVPGCHSFRGTQNIKDNFGRFSIIYLGGRGWVRLVHMFGVMVKVYTTKNINPDP